MFSLFMTFVKIKEFLHQTNSIDNSYILQLNVKAIHVSINTEITFSKVMDSYECNSRVICHKLFRIDIELTLIHV